MTKMKTVFSNCSMHCLGKGENFFVEINSLKVDLYTSAQNKFLLFLYKKRFLVIKFWKVNILDFE